ncbi:MAG TPA: hypothetical protein IAC17_04095 [Candidatus Faecousia faecipullorum]|nr:hypothetical protein [Candidatus Faecousia faecipullorum]
MAFVESEVVELKAAVVGDICKEVVAFANTKGGDGYSLLPGQTWVNRSTKNRIAS